MYQVYVCDSDMYYHGMSLIAAENAEEANKIIEEYKQYDKDNKFDSRGYCEVTEADVVECVTSDMKGIVYYGIRYGG